MRDQLKTKLDLKQAFEVLGRLPRLSVLHLEDNQLNALPENLRDLTHLKELYLSRNMIKNLRLDLKQARDMDYLDVQGNPMNKDSKEYLERTGLRFKF